MKFIKRRPLLVMALLWFVGLNVVFAQVHLGVIEMPGYEFLGSDLGVVSSAGVRFMDRQVVYPPGSWSAFNAEEPLLNPRYDPLIHVAFSIFGSDPSPWAKVAIQISLMIAVWLGFSLTKQILNELLPPVGDNLERWRALWLGVSSFMINISFLNIEIWVLVAVLYVILNNIRGNISLLAVLAVMFVALTKTHWLILILLFGLLYNWGQFLLTASIAVAGTLGLYAVLANQVGADYLLYQQVQRVQFLAATPAHFPWYLYGEIAPNSLVLVALRFFDPLSWWAVVTVILVMIVAGWISAAAIRLTTSVKIRSSYHLQEALDVLSLSIVTWSVIQALLWQVEYNSLAPFTFILVMTFGSRWAKGLALLLLPYLLVQFIDLVLMNLGFGVLLDTPLVLASLIIQIWVLVPRLQWIK